MKETTNAMRSSQQNHLGFEWIWKARDQVARNGNIRIKGFNRCKNSCLHCGSTLWSLISFVHRLHHWHMLCTIVLYLVSVQRSTTSDKFLIIFTFGIRVNLSRWIMPSQQIRHRGSGSTLETFLSPVLLYQTRVAQQVEHSVPGSRLGLLIISALELSRHLMLQRDFMSLSITAMPWSNKNLHYSPLQLRFWSERKIIMTLYLKLSNFDAYNGD